MKSTVILGNRACLGCGIFILITGATAPKSQPVSSLPPMPFGRSEQGIPFGVELGALLILSLKCFLCLYLWKLSGEGRGEQRGIM